MRTVNVVVERDPDTGMPQLLGEERRELETRSTLGSSEVARVVPGAFWDVAGEGRVRFPPPPGPPSSTNGLRGRWPIDADAPWKSHGRLRRTARTDPPTALSTELGKPAYGCRFSTSVNRPAALRRRGFARSLSFQTNGTYNRQSDAGDTINPSTQSGQVHLAHSLLGLARQRGVDHDRLRLPRNSECSATDTAGC